MRNIILTTTASFLKAVKESNLKDFLAKRGTEVVLHPEFEKDFSFDKKKVFGLVAGHTPSGKLVRANAELAKHFPNLKIVSPFGIGVDHIDFDGLKKIGVEAITLPHFSKRAVAELTTAFIFGLARRIMEQTLSIKSGIWERLDGQNICGKTIGIIGLGNIGKEVAVLAKGIGLRILAHDIVYDEKFNQNYGVVKTNLSALFKESDIITMHVPLTDITRNMINRRAFSLMRPGVLFINVARGEVVDDAALLDSLKSGHVAGAALDVYSTEPPFSNPTLYKVISHPRVIVTPHVGAFTPEIRHAIAKKICDEFVTKLN